VSYPILLALLRDESGRDAIMKYTFGNRNPVTGDYEFDGREATATRNALLTSGYVEECDTSGLGAKAVSQYPHVFGAPVMIADTVEDAQGKITKTNQTFFNWEHVVKPIQSKTAPDTLSIAHGYYNDFGVLLMV
jgi:hypothetical protein